PSNIMIGAFGELLMMDWGLAKVLSTNSQLDSDVTLTSVVPSDRSRDETSAATQDGTVLGTPGFMSPEQAAGKLSELTVRSDVFSLGKLLEFRAHQQTGPPAPRIPKPLRSIVAKASATDPADRYADVPELAKDVSLFLDGAPVSAHRENALERVRRF